jgi:hypothetical protein
MPNIFFLVIKLEINNDNKGITGKMEHNIKMTCRFARKIKFLITK